MYDTRGTRLVLGVLLLAAIGLITLDGRGAAPVARLRGATARVVGPAERAVAAIARPVAEFVEAVARAPALRREMHALEQRDQRLRAELSAAQLARTDAGQLGRLLSLAGRGGYRIVAARVIAVSAGYEATVTIDAGAMDGVRADQTVLDADGLVGRVTAVGPATAVVQLVSDASMAVGCRIEGSAQLGVVRGTGRGLAGGGTLRLEMLGAAAIPVPGQRLVTLGSVGGRPYVSGVPVGVITRAVATPGSLTRTALVRPFVDLPALDVVGVVVAGPRRDPRDSVLPPPPPPLPSGSARPPISPHAGRPAHPPGRQGRR